MKKIKTLLTILIGILLITSCSNDDDVQNNENQNSFTFKNETYEINFASIHTFDNHIQLTFSSTDLSNENFTGEFDFVGILFNSESLIPGNYTFKLDIDPNYDSSNNFFDAEAGVGLKMTNGKVETASNYYEKMNSGTIDIQNTGDIYTINFNLEFDKGTFNGEYIGTVE